ncbi:5'-nucleotidase C-terminal domain-containing protein [Sulfobacillus acidophilus]|uniref:5'-nucleotidase C-terminal domain-containing protein n=1 Tax=Sulfobacillus acidophilus TaxID=53633 RepID=A0ABS3AWA5_9FIRM|nr:5'-nucleotidase C-terminal domain-containing protein [Sulfobacillus acidophilus]
MLNAMYCVEFNTCEQETGSALAYLNEEFDISFNNIRTKENQIGNLVSDAIFEASKNYCEENENFSCPELAIINAGSIRQETPCGTRQSLPKGEIYQSDVIDLLPFSNYLVEVKISGEDILLALERAVSNLASGNKIHSPYFLQVSGISFFVDCKEDAQTLSTGGMQIIKRGNRIKNVIITTTNPPSPLIKKKYYEVATTSYLAQGNDGFLAFLQRDKQNRAITSKKGIFLAKYNPTSDNVLDENEQTITYAQTFSSWLKNKNEPIVKQKTPRISLDKSCFNN